MGHQQTAFFQKGAPFNALVIDARNPLIASTSPNNLIPTIIYSSDPTFNLGTIINGKWVVKENRHQDMDGIDKGFMKAIKDLGLR